MIPADRVETNVELNRILAELFPLLRAVRPADLNATLNALATALGGRGEELGQTLDKLGRLPRRDRRPPADPARGPGPAGRRRRHLQRRRARPARRAAQRHRHQQDDRRPAQGARRLLLRPRRAGGHLDPVLRDNEANLIRVGELTEPVMRAARRLLARVPLPAPGRGRLRPGLARTSGATDPAVLRVFNPQYRATTSATAGVRRDRPRALVLRAAEPAGADRRRTRSTTAADMDENPPRSTLPAAPLPPAAQLSQRVRRHRRASRQIVNAMLAAHDRPPGRQLRRARLADVRPRGREGELRPDEPRSVDTALPGAATRRPSPPASSSASSPSSRCWSPACSRRSWATSASAAAPSTRRSSAPPRCSRRATTSGSPASTSARSREVEHYERTGAGDLPGQGRDRADHRVARRDPVPQPGRRPLPRAGAGRDAEAPSRSRPATPSRSSRPAPPST